MEEKMQFASHNNEINEALKSERTEGERCGRIMMLDEAIVFLMREREKLTGQQNQIKPE